MTAQRQVEMHTHVLTRACCVHLQAEQKRVIQGPELVVTCIRMHISCQVFLCLHALQAEQTRVIQDPELVLSFEMFCALLNNNVECYERALAFVEEVQVR
jgi:hypothetical protein